jgi:broad specificity phosphatase PhoE
MANRSPGLCRRRKNLHGRELAEALASVESSPENAKAWQRAMQRARKIAETFGGSVAIIRDAQFRELKAIQPA